MLENRYHAAYQYARNRGGFIDCKYNRHINCYAGADCNKCGWNPAVEGKRKAHLETWYKGYLKFIKLERKADIGE